MVRRQLCLCGSALAARQRGSGLAPAPLCRAPPPRVLTPSTACLCPSEPRKGQGRRKDSAGWLTGARSRPSLPPVARVFSASAAPSTRAGSFAEARRAVLCWWLLPGLTRVCVFCLCSSVLHRACQRIWRRIFFWPSTAETTTERRLSRPGSSGSYNVLFSRLLVLVWRLLTSPSTRGHHPAAHGATCGPPARSCRYEDNQQVAIAELLTVI